MYLCLKSKTSLYIHLFTQDTPRTKFGESIFTLLIDLDSEVCEFGDFLHGVSIFCMFGKDEVHRFCFRLMDENKNGLVEMDEFLACIKMIQKHSPLVPKLQMDAQGGGGLYKCDEV